MLEWPASERGRKWFGANEWGPVFNRCWPHAWQRDVMAWVEGCAQHVGFYIFR